MKPTTLLAAGLFAALGGASTGAQAQTKLLLSTFFPQTHPLYAQVLQPWARDLEKATNGELKIEFSPSSLAPPPGQLDLVAKGIADVSIQYAGVVPNRLHLLLMTEVPGAAATTTTSAEAMSVALWRTHQKFFQPADEHKGLSLLAQIVFPVQDFYGVKEAPLTSIEALKSAKIATTPGLHAKKWGAVTTGVVAGPAFKYYELVSKGTVDAYAAATAIDVFSFNLAQYTKYALRFPDLGTAGSFSLVLNEGKWKSLSPRIQEAVTRLSGEAFARRAAELDRVSEANMKKLRDQGVSFMNAPAGLNAELKKAFAFLVEEWIAEAVKRGVDGKAALEFYRAEQTRLAGAKK
jgi:TRAP-type C4-dicarboxylate transport system substrate-binding protein